MPKVLISDELSDAAVQIFRDRGVEVDFQPKLGKDPAKLAEIIGDYDGLAIRSATKVTADLIARAGNLRVIGRAGIGVDNVDIPAASAKGIVVMNTPFGNSITTAEHAIAMMFACARQIPAADASTRAGKWEKSRFMGVEITGKTLGLVGCGNIGSVVATRAIGLKMRVIAYDPFLSAERAVALGVERIEELDELLARADFVTLHLPKTEKTANILSAERIARMKPGARLINCARGGLVDEAAVAEALRVGPARRRRLRRLLRGAGEGERAVRRAEHGLHAAPRRGDQRGAGERRAADRRADVGLPGAGRDRQRDERAERDRRGGADPEALDRAGRDARQLRRAGDRARDQGDRDRVRRRGRRAEPQAADRGADRRAPEAAGRRGRGQHGLGAGRRPRARRPHRRDPQGRPGRLRLLHAADRDHRGADPVGRRHDLLGRQAAVHPDQGDQPRGRADALHALHDQHRHARLHRRARHQARDLGVNIATFALGRAQKSGEAIALLGVDEAVAPEALAEIATLPQIRQAKALGF